MQNLKRSFAACLAALVWSIAPAFGTPNENFVSKVYVDLLERSPSGTELAGNAGNLGSGQTRLQFASLVSHSDEFYGLKVDDFYQLLLHRPADAPGLAAFVPLIHNGQRFEQTQATIAGANEYRTNRTDGTDANFLTVVFQDLLNRPIDGPTFNSLFSLLIGGGGHTAAAQVILDSTEYRTNLVTGYYNQFLGRSPSVAEISPFVGALGSGSTDQDVIAQILASQEYFDHAQNVPEPASALLLPGLLLLTRPIHRPRRPSSSSN